MHASGSLPVTFASSPASQAALGEGQGEEDEQEVPMSQRAVRNSGRRQPHTSEEDGSDSDGQRDAHEAHEAQTPAIAAHPAALLGPVKRSKFFNCPVHGLIRMDTLFVSFIDTRPFQRLRRLKQLGMAYWVFPGASHNRFEHSIGTCHKAFQFADHLWDMQRCRRRRPDAGCVDITSRDVRMVGLAGLLHDLGHGPFSHVFEHEILRQKNIEWSHEDMSCQLVDYIRDTYHLDSVSDDDVRLVKHLITGQNKQAPHGKRFLFDIVHNQRNSIDVDKADYLTRDALHCGIKVSLDFDRLMNMSKVINDEVCFKWSEFHNICQLFSSRQVMHQKCYSHRKTKAVELMVADALLEADVALGFTKDIHDPEAFLALDDTLVNQISNYGRWAPVPEGHEQPLKAAKAILDRLEHRDLYRYVNEVLVPFHLSATWEAPQPAELCSYWSNNGDVRLDPSQVHVARIGVNWALKHHNPLNHVGWFNDLRDTEKRTIPPSQMTSLMPTVFQEYTLRVYSKDPSPRVVAALNCALAAYAKACFGSKTELATPCKSWPSQQQLQQQVIRLHSAPQAQTAQLQSGASEEGAAGGRSSKRRRSLADQLHEAA